MTSVSNDDFIAIERLISDYHWKVDEGDPAWAELFTPDGTFMSVFARPSRGREDLRDIPRQTVVSAGGSMCHHMSNLQATYGTTVNQVTARYMLLLTTSDNAGVPALSVVCRYYMELIRDGDSWQVSLARPEPVRWSNDNPAA